MPFTHISLPSIGSWPIKPKTPTSDRSRQGSVDLSKVSHDFGVPQADDPDPFGVLALQRAGLLIKEAGTKSRPTSDTFEFRPSPSSPIFRQSGSFSDAGHRLSRQDSRRSNRSLASNDAGTQTTVVPAPEPQLADNTAYMSPTQIASATIPSPVFERTHSEAWNIDTSKRSSRDGHNSPVSPHGGTMRASPLRQSLTPEGKTESESAEEKLKAAAALAAEAERKRIRSLSASQRLAESLDKLEQSLPNSAEASPDESSSSAEDSEPEVIVETIVSAPPQTVRVMTPTVVSPTAIRAKLVTIKGKPAPAIPARNPRRQRPRPAQAENGGEHLSIDGQDESSSAYSLSPTRSAFDQNDDRASIPWSEQTSIQETDHVSAKSLRATPEPAETTDVSVGLGLNNGDTVAKDQPEVISATASKGASGAPVAAITTEASYVPSAAAHTSPMPMTHLEVQESQDRASNDTTPTTPQPPQPLDAGLDANGDPRAPTQDHKVLETASVSDYGHDDTQSQYADDEAEGVKPTGLENTEDLLDQDDDSEAFHSTTATPVRTASPLNPELVVAPLKTTANKAVV